MRILEMTASFGCLNRQTLRLTEGVNVLVLPNESGKSTWAAFLAAMFYGIDSTERAAKGRIPAKVRYQPWSGAPMEGTVTLLWQGKPIVLQRTSEKGKPMGTFRAYDPETGLDIPGLTGENCGRVLLGVEKEVFRRTAFLSGGELAVTQEQDLSRRLANLAAAGEMEENYPEAAQRLRVRKNQLRYHHRGLIPETEEKLVRSRQTARTGEALQARRTAALRQLEELRAESGTSPERNEKNTLLALLLLPVYLIAGGVCVFLKMWALAAFLGLAAVCFLGIYFRNRRYNRKVIAEKHRADGRMQDIHKLETEAAVLEAQIEALPREDAAQLEQELEELQFNEEAVILALEALEQAQEELEQGYGPRLTACAGELLQNLTRGQYDGLTLDRDLNLSLREAETGLTRSLCALSKGTQDLAWLALRIAMTRLLLPQSAPMVLDDALLTLDRERTDTALETLSREGRQALIFSCKPL